MKHLAKIVIQERKEELGLQLITGGKEPPNGTDTWLDRMPEGTVFFAQSKTNPTNYLLTPFRLVKREGKVTLLQTNDCGTTKELYVNAVRFTNAFQCYEDMGILQEQKETPHDGDRLQGDSGDPNAAVE